MFIHYKVPGNERYEFEDLGIDGRNLQDIFDTASDKGQDTDALVERESDRAQDNYAQLDSNQLEQPETESVVEEAVTTPTSNSSDSCDNDDATVESMPLALSSADSYSSNQSQCENS